jgi:hypothetical protein
MMANKWFTFKETKETFVDFNKDNAENSNITVYIPQYSKDRNQTLIHLYDNLYIDQKNGAVIEVEGSQNGQNDNSGNSISKIHISPRDGRLYTTYFTSIDNKNNNVIPIDTAESKITTTNPSYSEYTYITETIVDNTKYQYFYYTWNSQTFIHLFTISSQESKISYKKSFMITPTDGLKYTITSTQTNIPSKIENIIYDEPNNKKNISLQDYLNGMSIFQITPYVFYDIVNGNIILKDSTNKLTVYDRSGSLKTSPTNIGQSNGLSGQPTVFIISNETSGMVLVTSYNDNTIISVIAISSSNTYKIAATQRFNKTQPVNDLASDIENTPAATTPSATTPPGGWDKWNEQFNKKWNENYDGKMNCGTDSTCWYWFFKALPSFKDKNDMSDIYNSENGNSFISDDYFLKTEVVPPVCPQCPNCPGSGYGTCTSCGGNGGSGTNTCSSINLKLEQVSPGRYKDSLGNIYVAYSDSSGNTKYVLQGTGTSAHGVGKQGTGGLPNNFTAVDQHGQFVSTADPNTVGGGVSLSTLTLGQTGTSLLDNTAGIANNVINTAGGALGTAGNLAYNAGSGAVNLLKDTGSGAVNLLKDTGSGAVGLLKDAGSGIANLGSGRLQDTQGSRQYTSTTGLSSSSSTNLGSVSDKTFGKMQGQTPVDNYSYYGALQSKGGNFMPVTADFSSFRK